ncbi:ice-binding family protein [Sabulibacter ruber]|uniref:ice-binding family protein n=1 Tax=Sabulibacter ruber TaxID=2811901 RepID=UPI001A97AD23|nr:ice-binding family protein [Sabulibacter ruber]
MKIRLLLIIFSFLFVSEAIAQKSPALKSLQRLSVIGGAGVKNTGNSKIAKGILPAVSRNSEVSSDLDRVYAELQKQQPTTTLSSEALSGGKLQPGVYRVKGNAHLRKSIELLGSKHPNAVFVFQIDGNLQVDPHVKIELRQGVRAKNVFWQVTGNVTLAPESAFKGTILSEGNITATNTSVQGKLLSKSGSVTVSKTDVTELGSDNVSDLEIKHVVSEGPFGVGLLVTYTITLKNLGPDPETNVVVNFETPSGLLYLSAVTSLGSLFDPIRREWLIQKFPSGASATMVVKASILKTEFSTTVATVTGDGTDPNIKNNSSELSICATPSKLDEISGKTALCINTTSTFTVPAVSGARKYAWTLPAGWSVVSGGESNTITVSTGGTETQGTISVRAVNACGEGPESTLPVSTISSPPPMPSTIAGPKEICAGQREITYAINPVAGAISYQWELPAGWTVVRGQGTTSVTVNTGTTGGKVKVTAENSCGKSASSEVQVNISPSAPQKPGLISGPEQVCANTDRITYQVAAVANATNYTWTIPAGWSIISGQGTATLVVRAGSTGGQVSVKAGNICGTSPETSLRASIFTGVPTVGAISGNTSICFSNAEQTYSVEDTPGVTYTWSVPADWRILSGQGSRRLNVKVGSTGEVKLIATNPCGEGATVKLRVSVSTNVPTITGVISGPTAPCFSQENLTYSVTATNGPTGYNWSVPEGWAIVSGQGTASITVKAGKNAGNISVSANNDCGTSPVKLLPVAPVTILPVAPVAISGETAPCVGGQATYTISNPVAGLSYSWVLPAGWSIVSGQGTASVTVKAGNNGGQVKVTASNACGQSTATELTVSPTTGIPALTATIQGQAAVCANTDQLTYSISSTNAASSFTWQVPAGWVITSGQGTNQITVKAGSNSGTIQVSAKNGCGQSTSRSLAVSVSGAIPPTPAKITGPANLCANQGEVTYSIAAVAGATSYTWAVPTGWTIVRGQGTTSLVVRVGGSTAQVSVTASNACGTSTASALNVNMSGSAPAAIGAIAGDKAFCVSTAPRTYSVAEVEGTKTYTWSVPAGWSIVSGQGTRTISVKPGNTGGYVKVVAANYCGTRADSTNISISQPLSATPTAIKGVTAPCVSDAALTYSVEAVSGATQYTWSVPAGWVIVGGQGTNSIQVKAGPAAGAITVAAANACGASAAVRLEVAPVSAPILPAGIIGEAMPCGGGTEQTYTIKNPVAGVSYTWTLPTGWTIVSGQNTSTLIVKVGNAAGNLTVKASNACGSSAAQVLVVAPTTITPATDPIQGSTALCATTVQTYSVAALAGVTSYQWQVPTGWTIVSGQGSREIQVRVGSGSGEIAVTTQYTCGTGTRRTLSVTAGSNNLSAPLAITGNSGVCAQANQITYSVQPVAGATSYEWKVPAGWTITSGQGTTTITVQAGSASGQVTVASKNACSTSTATALAVSVSPSSAPVLGAITGQTGACGNARGTYTVAAVAGVNIYTWIVPNGWTIEAGQGTNTITVVSGSTGGTISVTGVNGCGLKSTPSSLPVQIQSTLLLKPNPIVVAASALKPCAGQKGLVFRIDAVAGATSYAWTFPADWKVESGQGTTTITVTAGSSAGMVSVVAKNACGQSESRTVAVTPSNGVPVINGDINGNSMVCANGGSVIYSISGATGADQYTWTIPSGWTLVSGQNTTAITVIPSTNSGTIKVKATNTCGVGTEKSLSVMPSATSLLSPTHIDGPTTFCVTGEQQTYRIPEVTGASSYVWNVPIGWEIISGQGSTSIKVISKAGDGEISVRAANGCSSVVANLPVSVAPPLEKALSIIDESSPCVGNQFSVAGQPGLTYTWTILTDDKDWSIASGQGTSRVTVLAPANASLSPARISVVASNGNCSVSSGSFDITPRYLAPELNIPNVFSPNHDGQNDLWVVRNLLEYPENELVVLNRWGSEVYRMKKYRNNWDGSGLAEGTYYYVLRVRLCDNEEKTYKGYVTVMR